MTGRSSTLADYVRFGQNEALIEIELKNNRGANYIIQRKLIKSERQEGREVKIECRSEWMLNGSRSTLHEVRDFVQKNLNITVDNLCQFLPQERVVEFVKMNTQQLLENTEKAAGDPGMYQDHQTLKDMSRRLREIREQKTKLEEKTQEDERHNQRVEEEVERMRERKKVKEELKIINLKKPWILFEEKRKEYVTKRDKLDQLLAKKKKEEKKIDPYKKEAVKVADKWKEAQQQQVIVIRNQEKLRKEVSALSTYIKTMKEKADDSVADFTGKLRDYEKKQQIIQKLKSDIESAQKNLEQYGSKEEIQQDMEKIDTQLRKSQEESEKLYLEKNSAEDDITDRSRKVMSLRQKMSTMDTMAKRRQLLSDLSRHANSALDLLEENRDKFSRNIYPPLMLLIDVKEASNAKFVEGCIAKRDLAAFVCEDAEDMKIFSGLLRQKNMRVPLVMAPSERGIPQPSHSARQLKQLGFTSFVLDLFEAPEPVVEYLCNQYYLHDIPVGGESVADNLNKCQKLGLRTFFSPTTRYSASKSHYDNEYIVVHDQLQEPRYLTIMRDEKGIGDLKKQEKKFLAEIEDLKKKLNQISEKISKITQKQEQLRQEKKGLQGQLEEITRYVTKIDNLTRQLQEREAMTFDREAEIREMKKGLEEEARDLIGILKEAVKQSKKLDEAMIARLSGHCKVTSLKLKKEIAEKNVESMKSLLQNINNEIRSMETLVESSKKEAKSLRTKAEQTLEAAGFKLDGRNVPEAIKEKFDAFPDGLNELEAKIAVLQTRLENMTGIGDERMEEDFNQRSQQIEQNKKQIAQMAAALENLQIEMDTVRERWINPLTEMICRINDNFKNFMRRMGYAGEVVLSPSASSNVDDYSSYGLVIRVKYRDSEDVQDLSAFHQSGGERSVATVLYMMALQELTRVPFRCVDEINQGMDSANERKVFDLIVDTAMRNESQYFLLSPKLLLGLNYSPKMTIHSISNGVYLTPDWLDDL